MKFLLDTDAAADYLVGRALGVETLEEILPDGVGLSIVSYGELFEGVIYSRNPEAATMAFEALLTLVTVVPLDEAIMRRYGILRGELRKRGQMLADPGLMIASTALERDLVLVSRNLKHFGRVPELALYWTGPNEN